VPALLAKDLSRRSTSVKRSTPMNFRTLQICPVHEKPRGRALERDLSLDSKVVFGLYVSLIYFDFSKVNYFVYFRKVEKTYL
jgi:hypothetical protein